MQQNGGRKQQNRGQPSVPRRENYLRPQRGLSQADKKALIAVGIATFALLIIVPSALIFYGSTLPETNALNPRYEASSRPSESKMRATNESESATNHRTRSEGSARPATKGTNRVVELSAATGSTCARFSSGIVKCWGKTFGGEPQKATPDLTPVITGAKHIVGSFGGHYALLARGRVRCWDNIGAREQRSQPLDASIEARLAQGRAHAIAGNGAVNCAHIVDGDGWCWGINIKEQLGPFPGYGKDLYVRKASSSPLLTKVKTMASGASHSCMVRSNGSVACWGGNNNGELGRSPSDPQRQPRVVRGLTGVKEIAVGFQHSCAITEDRRVRCWGRNDVGQLGMPSTGLPRSKGRPIDGPTDAHGAPYRFRPAIVSAVGRAQFLALGGRYSCAITDDGSVTCWGSYLMDREPPEGSRPSRLPGLRDVNSLVTSQAVQAHSCALQGAGNVYCWGVNNSGEAGGTPSPFVAKPQRVEL